VTDADHYTNPERAAEVSGARKVLKRVKAAQRKFGACCICIHREVTFDRPHCRNNPGRSMGQCNLDNRLPKFALDDQSLEQYRDAA
jgi:hypothetical protein